MQAPGYGVVPISAENRGGDNGSCILVVEDDRPTRELLAAIFTEEGLPFRLTANGHEAMEQARAWPPCLVVLDAHLPSLPAEALATALRIEHGPRLPILVMSAARELELATRIGAYAYLQKPFELGDFVQQIRRGLELVSSATAVREQSRLARARVEESVHRQQQAFERALKASSSLPKSSARVESSG